jgi:YgiT-type zinc finger domain-containing protein
MKCVVCRSGETKPGTATVTVEREGAVVVVRGVPARICENCGEEYLEGQEVARLQVLVEAYDDAGRPLRGARLSGGLGVGNR